MLDRIIQFSLKNRLLVIATAAFILVYGILVLRKLPVDVFPDLNRPTVSILTEAPGMAPEEVETLVSLPLETALGGLPGVERIRSASGIGLSVVYVEFGWGTEIYRNRQLIAEKLALAKERLPSGITPVMGPIASIMGEIQLVGLSSSDESLSPLDLRTIADWTLRPRLLSIPGVAQVIPIGGGVKQFQILIDAEKLRKYQLVLEEVQKNLSMVSQNTTGGFINQDQHEFLVRNLGTVKTKEDIETSVVGLHFGKPVLVKDIAEVKLGAQVKRGDASVNGKPAVILSIQKQPGANTIELTKRIDKTFKEIQNTLPKGVQLNTELFRQANFIENAINNVKEAIRDGVLLVILVLFLFLANLRTTAITLTAIPLSFMLTALVFYFFGLSVNTMTLGGLAVAIGELVDDAVVDVENVFRRLRANREAPQPKPTLQVVYEASSEIRNSIVFATIIVVLVFIPLFYLSGIEGRLFIPLGIAYIVSIIASLFVSLTVTPVLCSYLLSKDKLKGHKDSRFVRFLKNRDEKILIWALDRPKLIIGSSLVLFLLAISAIPFMGREFLPKFNEGTATIGVFAQPGISLEKSNHLGTEAEEIILSTPEVKSVARRTGRAELDEHAEGIHSSEIDVDFKEGGRPRPIVLDEIRENLEELKGAFISVGQPISHRLDHLLSGVRAQIAIKIFGPELSVLRSKAAEISEAIEDTEGLVDLQTEQQVLIPQIKIKLLREEAAENGIIIGELSKTLETALNGEIIAQVIENQKTFNVFMRFDDKSRANPELIQNATMKIMPDGRKIALRDIAEVYESVGPNAVNRENSQRRIIVSANVTGRDLDSIVGELQKKVVDQIELPDGYFIQWDGQFESQRDASRMITLLGLLSILGVFLVLYAHFKSSFIAAQIMLNIPLALIGGIIGILITDRILSVASLVAFITLSGIASRNGIMMISHYLHLMKYEGEEFSKKMVVRGSIERLVPVLMTALTAGLALVPLVLSRGAPGKEILHPLSVVIFGGLISSTLLDMILTPTVFYNFGKKSAEQSIKEESL